jgi:predicted DNA-binding protein
MSELSEIPSEDEKKQTVTFRLTRETIRRLDRVTRRIGSNKSSYIERALRAVLRKDEIGIL